MSCHTDINALYVVDWDDPYFFCVTHGKMLRSPEYNACRQCGNHQPLDCKSEYLIQTQPATMRSLYQRYLRTKKLTRILA